jgi:hypothetical protein
MSQLHEGEDLSGEWREPKVARGCMKCELNCESGRVEEEQEGVFMLV